MKAGLLDSWDRQVAMLDAIAGLVNQENRKAKQDADGWALDFHLAHIHEVRYYWLSHLGKQYIEGIGDALRQEGEEWLPIDDLDEIKHQLQISAAAVRRAMDELLEKRGTIGPYDDPVLFLQHMVWHEGYHFALMRMALRVAGQEPTEEWEDAQIWGRWRNYG